MSTWHRPESLSAAMTILARLEGRARIIQGGTDVMVACPPQAVAGDTWLDLSGVAELQKVDVEADGVLVIGAGVRLAKLREDPRLYGLWPNLAISAGQTGSPAIQNRATLGGNICNASPAADNAPALLVYDAELEISGPGGSYRLPYWSFHRAYRQTALGPGEIVTRIRLRPPPTGTLHYFRKVGTRAAQAISKVALAATLRVDAKQRLVSAAFAFASVAAVPVLAGTLAGGLRERSLTDVTLDEIRRLLAEDIAAQSDIRSTQAYRTEIAARLVWEFIQSNITTLA